jgi:hypothetical protein
MVQRFRQWTGADENARLGQELYEPNHQYTDDVYWYGLGPFNVAASTGSMQFINISSDADFEWAYTTAYATATAAPTYPYIDGQNIPITVLISDGGSGRNLTNVPILLSSIAGVGREPYVMPLRRILAMKATVNFNFTNLDAVNAWDNVSLTLHGRKIFDLGPIRR